MWKRGEEDEYYRLSLDRGGRHAVPDPHYPAAPLVKRFVGYRPAPPEAYYAQGAANAPDEPQYEGVVFSDGTVVCRWLTEYRSHSVWTCWNDFYNIHGHPEYGTRIDWPDGDGA